MNPIILRTTRIFSILLLSILGYYLLIYSLPILIPISLAALIAFMMEPSVLFLVNTMKLPRPVASITIAGLFTISSFLLLFLIVTEIYDGIAYLAELLPGQMQNIGLIIDHYFQTLIIPLYETILTSFNKLTDTNQIIIQDNLSGFIGSFALLLGNFFESLLFSIPQALAFVPESLTVVLFIFLASILLSADFPRIKNMTVKYIPETVITKLKDILQYLKDTAIGFMRAQIILVTVSFIIIFLGLLILDVKHAFTIALFMIFVDLIPFLGTGLFFIPWISYCFLTANYPLTIGLAVLYIVVILVRQIIEPKILAMNINIHPLTWLFAVFIGYKLFGVIGLLLAPFFIIFVKALHYTGVFHWFIRYIKSDGK